MGEFSVEKGPLTVTHGVKGKDQGPEQRGALGASCSQAEKGLEQSGKNPVVPVIQRKWGQHVVSFTSFPLVSTCMESL